MSGRDLLIENVPELFEHPGNVLYVGASPGRFELKEELVTAGHKVILLERYYPNAKHFRFATTLEWVI